MGNPEAALCRSLLQFRASTYYLRWRASAIILDLFHPYNIPWPKTINQVKLNQIAKKKTHKPVNVSFSTRGIRMNFWSAASSLLGHSPDIIILSVTNLNSTNEFSILNYIPLFRRDSSVHMHGHYIRENIPLARELSPCVSGRFLHVTLTFTPKLRQLYRFLSSSSFLIWLLPAG